MKQRLIKIDGKTRTDPKFPTGFMDVVQIDKTGENFRIIYDVKGRFTVHRITASEAAYKLCRVRAVSTGPKGVPYLHTSDGRTIRYPDPNAKVNDSIQLDLATNKVQYSLTHDQILLNGHPPRFSSQLPDCAELRHHAASMLGAGNDHKLKKSSRSSQLVREPGSRCDVHVELVFPHDGGRHLGQQLRARLPWEEQGILSLCFKVWSPDGLPDLSHHHHAFRLLKSHGERIGELVVVEHGDDGDGDLDEAGLLLQGQLHHRP